ncbi:hypothetical protein PENTCL1PPCAC_25105, partial [Pristionchus entomophagus]
MRQESSDLVEETEAHVVVGLLLGLFLLGCGGSGSSSSSCGGSGHGECAGVGEEGLDLLGLLEGDVGDGRDSEHVLETAGDGVGNGGSRGVLDGKRHGGDVTDSLEEARAELRGGEVEDLRGIDRSVVIDLEDNQAVRERSDPQHVEEGSLGSSDLVASGDEMNIVQDLDGSSRDLGGDLESLEERGLLGAHAGVLGRKHDIAGSDGSSLGGGTLEILEKLVANLGQVLLGEDESDVLDDVREELLKSRVLAHLGADGLADHGVLSHQNDELTTHGVTDLLHLLGSDIVHADDEALGELIEKLANLGEVVGLPRSLVFSNHLGGIEIARFGRFKD